MADVGFRELADAAVLSRAANVSTASLTNTTTSWTSARGMLAIAKRVMTFPGRLVERLRLLDELLQEDPYEQAEAIAAASREGRVVDTPLRRPNAVMNRNAGGVHAGAGSTSRQMQAATMPGPWGFFVSGYAAGVIILMFLLNRIHNVVTPSRDFHRSRSSSSNTRSRFWPFFPLNMNSTQTRLIMRLPTIILLLRSLALWTLVAVHTAGFLPHSTSEWTVLGPLLLGPLSEIAGRTNMEDLCWTTFLSVCTTLVVSALSRGLEGSSASHAYTRPFNIAGYAFMSFIYSQPISHTEKIEGSESRPNKHVLIMMWFPLFELTLIHCMGVKKRWTHQRLYPTALASILNLLHYHYVLWLSPSPYPLISFFHGAVESGLIFITTITVGLRAFAQLATTGAVRGPLLGHADMGSFREHEDFGVALLRLGTAALDATAVAGLANEVGAITAAPHAMDATDVVQLGATDVEIERLKGKHGHGSANGFGNEIRSVRAAITAEADPTQSQSYWKEVSLFGTAMWRFAQGLGRYISSLVRRRPWNTNARSPGTISTPARPASPPPRPRAARLEDEDGLYERFRRGQLGEADQDEDEEWQAPTSPTSPVRISSTAPSDTEDEGEDEGDNTEVEGENDHEGETTGLFTDHVQHPTSTAVMLAHLSNTSLPLTRRRYQRLADSSIADIHTSTGEGAEDGDTAWLQRRRTEAHASAAPRDEYDEARRRACVICTVDQRSIILWPCRCLALCEDCRANLASRASASKHSCPCCRQHIDGYSRIYIP